MVNIENFNYTNFLQTLRGIQEQMSIQVQEIRELKKQIQILEKKRKNSHISQPKLKTIDYFMTGGLSDQPTETPSKRVNNHDDNASGPGQDEDDYPETRI